MKIHQLTNFQASKNRRRVGRGIAAGGGKTAGRGTKGQNSRSGGRVRPGFEGGQSTLIKHLPKLPGFKSRRRPVQVVTTGAINKLSTKTVTAQNLVDAGLISDPYWRVKLIVKGQLEKAVTVSLTAASKGAIDQIKAAGGSFEKIDLPRRPAQSNRKTRQVDKT